MVKIYRPKAMLLVIQIWFIKSYTLSSPVMIQRWYIMYFGSLLLK